MCSCYAAYATPIHHTTRSRSPHNALHSPSSTECFRGESMPAVIVGACYARTSVPVLCPLNLLILATPLPITYLIHFSFFSVVLATTASLFPNTKVGGAKWNVKRNLQAPGVQHTLAHCAAFDATTCMTRQLPTCMIYDVSSTCMHDVSSIFNRYMYHCVSFQDSTVTYLNQSLKCEPNIFCMRHHINFIILGES